MLIIIQGICWVEILESGVREQRKDLRTAEERVKNYTKELITLEPGFSAGNKKLISGEQEQYASE